MNLDFYYYSYQCPLNYDMLKLLDAYKDRLKIKTYDISKDFMIAKKQQMYFPTLLVVQGKYRYFSPLNRAFLDALCEGRLPIETPYVISQGEQTIHGQLHRIQKENVRTACQCSGGCKEASCHAKYHFYKQLKQEIYGISFLDEDGHLLGGAEYVPSIMVPYDIPKDINYAFITCVYCSNEVYDYKTKPLLALEMYLKKYYDKVYLISDEQNTFPNGNLAFFVKLGYQDLGMIHEEKDYCKLHMMMKEL